MKIATKGCILSIIIFMAYFALTSCIKIHSIKFITEACIIPYKQYDYHTCKPMHVIIDGYKYVIPKNFTTDLASVPQPLWSFIAPQFAGYVAPSILHDYLYYCGNLCSRKFADEVLYSALINNDISKLSASKFYYAVRIFGQPHFEEHNENCTRDVYDTKD